MAAEPAAPAAWADVARWRQGERQRLIAARLAIDGPTRQHHAARIAQQLAAVLPALRGRTVAVYWPFRGEPDLRPWMDRVRAAGGVCALPVVLQRHAPLVFREWQPGARLARGVWNIPEPAGGADVLPDIVVAPLVGFDPAGYRLGYGGGFYDRTLAALPASVRAVGVGYAQAALATIQPWPHDIAMHAIVTEQGIAVPGPDFAVTA